MTHPASRVLQLFNRHIETETQVEEPNVRPVRIQSFPAGDDAPKAPFPSATWDQANTGDRFAFFQSCQQEHGDVFRFRLDSGRTMVVCLDVTLYEEITRSEFFDFAEVSRVSKQRFGMEQMTETDRDVAALSRGMRLAMSGAAHDDLCDRLDALLRLRLSQTLPDRARDEERDEGWEEHTLFYSIKRAVGPAAFEALFGNGTWKNDDLMDDIDTIIRALAGRLPVKDLTTKSFASDALERTLSALNDSIFSCPVEHRTQTVDVLHRTLVGDTHPWPHKEKEQVATLLWGGCNMNMIPTSFWLTKAVFSLPPAELERLRKDVASVVDIKNVVELADLPRLSRDAVESMMLIRSTVLEVLRMRERPQIFRVAKEDLLVTLANGEKVHLEKGDWVGIFARFLHMDPEVHENPETFQPDRFLPLLRREATYEKAGFPLEEPIIPFGIGVGRCPGGDMTLHFLGAYIALLVTFWDLEVDDAEVDIRKQHIESVSPPDGDLKARLRRRIPCELAKSSSSPMPVVFAEDESELPLYTLADVAQHDRPEDAWIVVENHVYDVTEFHKEHPGGAVPLLRFAGRDATKAFRSLHSRRAWSLLAELRIGRLQREA